MELEHSTASAGNVTAETRKCPDIEVGHFVFIDANSQIASMTWAPWLAGVVVVLVWYVVCLSVFGCVRVLCSSVFVVIITYMFLICMFVFAFAVCVELFSFLP